jgi:hypothetical protein
MVSSSAVPVFLGVVAFFAARDVEVALVFLGVSAMIDLL